MSYLGANVNHWHWEEYDGFPFAKQKVELAFKDLHLAKFLDEDVVVSSTPRVTGDCTMGIRKRKQWCVYDMELAMDWSASMGTSSKYTGEIKIPDFSNMNDGKHRVNITSLDAPPDLIEAIRTHGMPVIIDKLREVEAHLNNKAASRLEEANLVQDKANSAEQSPKTPVTPKAQGTATLNIKLQYDTSRADDLFYTLTDVGRMSMLTQSKAVVGSTAGDKFSLLEGMA